MKDWYIGQQIICVDNDWVDNIPPKGPEVGGIYTIAEMSEDMLGYGSTGKSMMTFRLKEIVNKPKEFFFYEIHFRPLEGDQMSILLKAIQTIPKEIVNEFNEPIKIKEKERI